MRSGFQAGLLEVVSPVLCRCNFWVADVVGHACDRREFGYVVCNWLQGKKIAQAGKGSERFRSNAQTKESVVTNGLKSGCFGQMTGFEKIGMAAENPRAGELGIFNLTQDGSIFVVAK